MVWCGTVGLSGMGGFDWAFTVCLIVLIIFPLLKVYGNL